MKSDEAQRGKKDIFAVDVWIGALLIRRVRTGSRFEVVRNACMKKVFEFDLMMEDQESRSASLYSGHFNFWNIRGDTII